MIETNCNKLSDGLGKMQKLNAVCRSYAAHKMDEQRALKAKKYLAMTEGDETDLLVAEARLEKFDQETRPVVERMRKALKPVSNDRVEFRNVSILTELW